MPLDDWNRELAEWPQILQDAAHSAGTGSVIVAGDFNSTLDMRPFRDLVRDGYRDAAEQSGAGVTGTYPANLWVPPLLAIDHVLTYRGTANRVQTVELPGSDHRGLIAVAEIPH
jgi:endonuclease/exonuclease/phosphatase (EEP) superfamily protein YafD